MTKRMKEGKSRPEAQKVSNGSGQRGLHKQVVMFISALAKESTVEK
jgi:hypothetical protein